MKSVLKVIVLALVFSGVAAGAFAQQDMTREEGWYSYDDRQGNSGSSVCKFAQAEETIGGKTYMVATMTGSVTTKYMYGFAGFGIKPNAELMAKVKAGKGIKFKAIGDGKKYRFKIETADIKDYDYYGKTFETKAGQVVEISLPFTYLQQEGWGRKIGFNKDKIWQIAWQSVGQPHDSVSLKVFDVQILP
jgi:hypothetical protein